MCGRYFLNLSPERLQALFRIESIAFFASPVDGIPSRDLPVIVRRRNGGMHMGSIRWGFPSPRGGELLKNARGETLDQLPSFAPHWRAGHRCLVPMSGFYEWAQTGDKIPYAVTHPVHETMVAAGLWRRDGDQSCFTIITGAATGALATVHHRAPWLMTPENGTHWLEKGWMPGAGPSLNEELALKPLPKDVFRKKSAETTAQTDLFSVYPQPK